MFVILYVLWIIWNGKFTVEIGIWGLVLCGMLYLFLYRFMEYRIGKELKIVKVLPRILLYLWHLVKEIVKANRDTAKMILDFSSDPDPVMVRFRTKVKSETGQVVVANSITLTPGTLTVRLKDGTYLVHSLDRDFIEGISTSGFVKEVVQLEEAMGKEKAHV